jgi:hypothetical protein
MLRSIPCRAKNPVLIKIEHNAILLRASQALHGNHFELAEPRTLGS